MKSGTVTLGLVALLLTGVSACSSTSENGEVVTVWNRTTSDLAVFPLGEGRGPLVDPNPLMPPGTFPNNRLDAGLSIGFDTVDGYAADAGIILFIYRVEPDGSASLVDYRTVSVAELKLRSRLVTIFSIPEPASP